MAFYEKIKHSDPDFPITFHQDWNGAQYRTGFAMHWHENIEILYFTGQGAEVQINNTTYEANHGNLVVINSNAMHAMTYKQENCAYHCILLEKEFCESLKIFPSEIAFQEVLTNEEAGALVCKMAKEMREEKPYYKALVRAYCIDLLVLLLRNYSRTGSICEIKEDSQSKQQVDLVKKVISYIASYYQEPISIDDIADFTGFSRYYICHMFKELTGQTVFDYLNLFRCDQARKMLATGKANISESALANGFNNLSYFARAYKKYIGVLPSEDLKQMLKQREK